MLTIISCKNNNRIHYAENISKTNRIKIQINWFSFDDKIVRCVPLALLHK